MHVVPRAPVTTVPKYDEMLMQQDKLSVNNNGRMAKPGGPYAVDQGAIAQHRQIEQVAVERHQLR